MCCWAGLCVVLRCAVPHARGLLHALSPTRLLNLSCVAVRYIETFHKWAGTSANPVSPWHQQGAFPMAGAPAGALRSMGANSPEPAYLMDD
jgi:hypothetical protein